MHGLAAALAATHARPHDSSTACLSLSPTRQVGRVRGNQEKHSPSRGVSHASRKEGLQEELGYKQGSDREACSVLQVVFRKWIDELGRRPSRP